MAKINAKVQLSPVKTHQDIVDEEDEEDGEDHTGTKPIAMSTIIKILTNMYIGDDEKLLSRLNGYRTPQKTSMDAAAYPKDGGLNNHEKHRHNEPHASKEDSYNDRRKSKSIFARVTGFLFTQSPSVEPSSQSVLPTQVVPIPLGKGRGGSTPPPEMYQTPMPWSDTLEGDAAMEPVDSATSIEGPPENGNQLEDPARSTGISLHLKEVPEVARPPEASMLSLVKPRPGDHSTKKRPSPRADPYDIPPSPTNTNGEEYADDFVRKSHKRVKLTKKKQPKQPIVVPKTHKQTGLSISLPNFVSSFNFALEMTQVVTFSTLSL
jgi:hypothetical protein